MRFARTLVLFILIAAALWAYRFLAPYGPSTETFVDIPAGTGTAGMASRLKAAGVIRSRLDFELLRKLKGGRLKAGEYRFDHPARLTEIYARIASGDVYTIPLTIPEGFNIFDIAAAVQAAKLAPADVFLAAEQHDTALIRDLAPHATSLEGFLFPDTYRFSPHATPDQMIARMVQRFRAEIAPLPVPRNGIGSPGPDILPLVTLASLIEKEVAVPAERPLVAGVFRNRLAQGMPLATDPTIIYAALLNHRWRGTIYQSDLAFDSPYNTYRRTGLPPGPIANPGLAALRAALNPAPTDFLYFVADSQGHSVFSKDLKQHNAAVQAYRAAQKAQAAP